MCEPKKPKGHVVVGVYMQVRASTKQGKACDWAVKKGKAGTEFCKAGERKKRG